jgi:hypothetical protein
MRGKMSDGGPTGTPIQGVSAAARTVEAYHFNPALRSGDSVDVQRLGDRPPRLACGTCRPDASAHLLGHRGGTPKSYARGPSGSKRLAALARLIANPRYVGQQRLNGQLYPTELGPLVDEVLWQEAQRTREASARTKTGCRTRPSAASHLFMRGMLRCHCGGSMYPRTIKPRSEGGKPYERYVAQRTCGTLRSARRHRWTGVRWMRRCSISSSRMALM